MEVYVARQPIFDRKLDVYAYELLFRLGQDNVFTDTDGDYATSSVITSSFLLIGINTLTDGRKAFINFTRNLLMAESATIIPKDSIVIEVLENIKPDKGILTACKKLKDLGYSLALDDFVFEPQYLSLLKLSDIIKVDFRLSDEEERRSIVQRFSPLGIKFLAEKIETHDEFAQAVQMGYMFFQGYFFSKPVIISTQDIPGHKINYLNILREIQNPDVNFSRIEQIIKHDVSISYKLLRFINSAYFGFSTKIMSIKQALVLLGLYEFRKWVSLIIMKGMGEDKPQVLVTNSIIRARFCELLATALGLKDRSSDLFLLGMFSLIDTFINRPMAEIMEKLPLHDEIKSALIDQSGRFGDIFNLVTAYERIDWDAVAAYAKELKIDIAELSDYYTKSIKWANQVTSATV